MLSVHRGAKRKSRLHLFDRESKHRNGRPKRTTGSWKKLQVPLLLELRWRSICDRCGAKRTSTRRDIARNIHTCICRSGAEFKNPITDRTISFDSTGIRKCYKLQSRSRVKYEDSATIGSFGGRVRGAISRNRSLRKMKERTCAFFVIVPAAFAVLRARGQEQD